jgi:hypothetical protein
MTSLRVFALLGSLALGSCTLLVKEIAKRCPVDEAIVCVDEDQAQIKCENGIEKRSDCDADETCVKDQGCQEIIAVCGNGDVEDGEDCDSDDLDGANCANATNGALPEGTLDCDNNNCVFDTSDCSKCGNGIIEGDEDCENNNLNDEDCDSATNGQDPDGFLFCNNNCTFNTDGCFGN